MKTISHLRAVKFPGEKMSPRDRARLERDWRAFLRECRKAARRG